MIIRDPVHGDLFFHESERRVMDTRQMQRLRGGAPNRIGVSRLSGLHAHAI